MGFKDVGGALIDMARLPFRRARPAGSISTGKADRKRELHGLAGGMARSLIGAKIRSRLRPGRRAEIEREALERATRTAVTNLGQMKGLSMKLGQMMSYTNTLPEEAERELAALQASVPPLEPEQLDALLHSLFGDRLEKSFREFDRTPIAAASVGQVHRAVLLDGRQVAVKLQYPGVDVAMRSDLDNIESLTALSNMTVKTDLGEYMRSLGDSFMRELDYTAELRSQQRLADLYRGHPYVLIPGPVPELSGPRVLVTEFVEGVKLQEAAAADQDRRDGWGEIMYRFAFGCMAAGFFSGDPHPGNYLFPADGRVCFLDFGMMIDFSSGVEGGRIAQLMAGGLGDPELLEQSLRSMGLLAPGVDPAQLWAELQPLVAGPIIGGRSRLDREHFTAAMKEGTGSRDTALARAFAKSPDLQGWMLLWLRYALGSLATISKLAPEQDWRQILTELALGAEPVGEIGRAWGSAPGGHLFLQSGVLV